MYRHTQSGRLMVLSSLGMFACALAAGALTPRSFAFYPLALAAAFIYFGFRELTVEVDHEEIRLTFGAGWFKKAFPLSGVESAAAVRNSWWNGWGVKYNGRYWLYNVDGFDAVELRFRDGRAARIGTDEPAALEAAIRARLAKARPLN